MISDARRARLAAVNFDSPIENLPENNCRDLRNLIQINRLILLAGKFSDALLQNGDRRWH